MLKDYKIGRLISFFLPFTLYLFFISPGVTGGDAGELASAGYILGIPHPPGYPLYTILGRIFSMPFPSNPAAGTNLLSVLFGAGTTLLLYIYLRRKIDKTSALISTLIFAITPVFFSQAIRTEVYTITTFFFILELYLIEEKKYLLLSYISGLSILVHPLLWLLFPYIFFLIVKNYKKGIFFILLGFSISLYLPIRARLHPVINWGDPETIPKFFYHLLRLAYYKEAPKYSLSLLIREYKIWGKALIVTSHFWLLASIFGIFFTKEKRRLCLLLFVYSLLLTFLIHSPVTPDRFYIVEIFYLPQLILLIIGLGYGLNRIKIKYRWLLGLFFIIINIFLGKAQGIFWRDWTAEDFKNAALSQIEKGDVIISEGDAITFSLLYGAISTKKAEVFDTAGDLRNLPNIDSIMKKRGYIWSINPLGGSFHIPMGLLWWNGLHPINNPKFDWDKIDIRFGGQQNPLEREIYVHYLLMKARGLFSEGKRKDAILNINEAEDCALNHPHLLNHIGTLLAEYKFYKWAKVILMKALQNGFIGPDIYHNIALIEIHNRNLDEAYKYVKAGLKSYNDPVLYNDLGIIFTKMGRINNARTMFFKAEKMGLTQGLINFIRTFE